jgi:hypothetical protein
MAASLLRAASLEHTIARDPEDMITLTRRLVASRQRLRALRRTLSNITRGKGGDRHHGGGGSGGGGDAVWNSQVWAVAFERLVSLLWQVVSLSPS